MNNATNSFRVTFSNVNGETIEFEFDLPTASRYQARLHALTRLTPYTLPTLAGYTLTGCRLAVNPANPGESIANLAHIITRDVLKTVSGADKPLQPGRALDETSYNSINQRWTMRNDSMQYNPANPDVQDLIQAVSLTVWEQYTSGATLDEIYSAGYATANHIVYSEKARATRETYIEDINGDIVRLSAQLGRIVSASDKYIPTAQANPELGRLQARFACRVALTLSPIQRQVLLYRANNPAISCNALAKHFKRDAKTMRIHLANIAEKGKAILDNNPDFDAIRVDRPGLELAVMVAVAQREKIREKQRARREKAKGEKQE